MSRARIQSLDMIAALRRHLGAVPLEIGALRHLGTDDATLLRRALAPGADPVALLAWCGWQQVHEGAQILIRPDPTAVHPWLLADDVPTAAALAFAARRAALVIETSPGNCQCRILADRPLSMCERTTAQRALCAYLGGDVGSIAGDKWGRLPGFRNVKPGRAGCWTNLLRHDLAARPVSAAALLAQAQTIATPAVASAPALDPLPSALLGRGCVALGQGSPRAAPAAGGARPQAGRSALSDRPDRSARHFAFACHALRRGENPAAITRKIADRAMQDGKRPDEASAMAYALGVVAAAQVRLIERSSTAVSHRLAVRLSMTV